MKFPESWLRSFCDPQLSTEALAERLTMSGLEVEEIGAAAPPFTGVVVARITAVARHPNADKLSVCEVDVGGSTKTIVCGAPNVAAGLKVPCALPGAVLPGGFAIKPRQIIRQKIAQICPYRGRITRLTAVGECHDAFVGAVIVEKQR